MKMENNADTYKGTPECDITGSRKEQIGSNIK